MLAASRMPCAVLATVLSGAKLAWRARLGQRGPATARAHGPCLCHGISNINIQHDHVGNTYGQGRAMPAARTIGGGQHRH